MNLQQLKAKYATAGATTTVPAASTVSVKKATGRAWDATKSATVSAGTYVKDIAPATNRRVNSIASELNAQLNNHDKELFKHQIMIEMIAQATGVNLPEDEVLEQYYAAHQKELEEAAKAKEEARKEESVDSLTAKVMEHVLAAFKKHGFEPKKEEKKSVLTPEQEVFVDEQIKELEETVEEIVEEAKEEAPVKKEGTGRRRLGRQAPLAE